LLTNAIKFTDTGIVKLCAAINERTDDSITIHFTVRDSGIGMTPEQIEKIFEPFAQAEAKTMRKCAGTGLGLPIAKNIIELMGGKLFVESAPEAGSKFSFDLTFNTIKADSEELNKKIHMGEIKRPSFNAEVLLCEDNLMNQQVICEHFEKVGLKIAVAENGKIAVDFVKKRKENNEKQFDIIFMDINMPVMDGLEASAKIHEIDSTIPIIAITANMIDNNNDIYAKAGMKDFISKPFTSQELWHCLLRFLTPSETASEKTDNDTKTEADKEFQIYLKTLFIKNNKEKYQEIVKALEAGDTKLANRLAHTLKSNSGQLGLNALHQAADDVEKHLAGGENLVLPQQLTALEYELNQAILQLAQIVTQYNELNPVNSNFNSDETQNLMDIQSTLELLDKLEPMLKFGNTKSLEYIDSLYQIYADNTVKNQLVQHIKEFDFEIALGLLFQIREQLNTD
ncbi:MAG: response regulator, partial [Treponema sp.]|nr:response regulator [Treponema sp.]